MSKPAETLDPASAAAMGFSKGLTDMERTFLVLGSLSLLFWVARRGTR